MGKKYTYEQKQELKELRKRLAELRKYVPCGQGDGFNRDRGIADIRYKIEQVKAGQSARDMW